MMELPILDLFVLSWVGFAGLFGARRGVIAEGLAGAGLVVTGALVIMPPLDLFARQGDGAAVLVSVASLLVGIGSGNWTVRRLEPGVSGRCDRIVGALCGALNAAWVATFLLAEWRYGVRLGSPDRWVSDAWIGRILVANVELALLATSSAVLVVSGYVAIGSVWSRLNASADTRMDWRHRGLALSGTRGVRLPAGADGGKLDPATEGGSTLAAHVAQYRIKRTTRSKPCFVEQQPRAWPQSSAARRHVGPYRSWYRIASDSAGPIRAQPSSPPTAGTD